jgi:hypothetical protein
MLLDLLDLLALDIRSPSWGTRAQHCEAIEAEFADWRPSTPSSKGGAAQHGAAQRSTSNDSNAMLHALHRSSFRFVHKSSS